MNEELVFDVGALNQKSTGAKLNYSFKVSAELEGLKLLSDIEGDLEIMRLEKGLNVAISNFHTSLEGDCHMCLKAIKRTLEIAYIERQFYFSKANQPADPLESFLVDTKNLKIDLSEMIRQEIILHFTQISVCSTSCKGICSICGGNRNEKACECRQETEPENTPLSALKELLK
ncbi:DUF177 domain-containing protein [Candidatus Gracilibacteria bacterium]|nr:DUF177 domain-containing protein [Candidatus Gracilibacteria bacterium]